MILMLILLIFSFVLVLNTHTKIYPARFLAITWSIVSFGISLWVVEEFSFLIVIPTFLSLLVAWGVFWIVNYLYESVFLRAIVLVIGLELMLLTLFVANSVQKVIAEKFYENRQELSIEPLKEYALAYQPCDGESCYVEKGEKVVMKKTFFSMAPIPKNVEYILKERVIDDEFIVYNSLIASRFLVSQLYYANQSYQISVKHPVWRTFRKYSNIEFNDEFETSDIIYAWLRENEQYSTHPILNEEYQNLLDEYERINSNMKDNFNSVRDFL